MATRIDQLEVRGIDPNAVLQYSLKHQNMLIGKVEDLQSRSRRNNLRIYRLPEDSEGGSVTEFVENQSY